MGKWLDSYREASEENRILVEIDDLQIDIAEKLYRALEETGMTRSEFAKKAGWSPGYITRLLKGEYNLSIAKLCGLAYHLGCGIEVSFHRRENKKAIRISGELSPRNYLRGNILWTVHHGGGEICAQSEDMEDGTALELEAAG